MFDAYIGLPTLTAAQQAYQRLRAGRIPARVVRMPSLANVRCAYGVQLPGKRSAEALVLLREMLPGRELHVVYDRRGRSGAP